jgi:hypothetical protein
LAGILSGFCLANPTLNARTFEHVVQHSAVPKESLELTLPHMVMRIDKSRRNYFALAVDNRSIFGFVDTLANLNDATIRDQDIRVSEINNVVFLIMLKNSAILKEYLVAHFFRIL